MQFVIYVCIRIWGIFSVSSSIHYLGDAVLVFLLVGEDYFHLLLSFSAFESSSLHLRLVAQRS